MPSATDVFDRGYMDAAFWNELDGAGCYFVTRAMKNYHLDSVQKRIDPTPEIFADELLLLEGKRSYVVNPIALETYSRECHLHRLIHRTIGYRGFLPDSSARRYCSVAQQAISNHRVRLRHFRRTSRLRSRVWGAWWQWLLLASSRLRPRSRHHAVSRSAAPDVAFPRFEQVA